MKTKIDWNNPKEVKEYNKNYQEEKKESLKEKRHEYYVKNKIKIKQKIKEYQQSSPRDKERRKKYKQRPEVKERVRKYNQIPEVKVRHREYFKKHSEIPEIKEKQKKRRKEYYQRPYVQQRVKEYRQKPEVKARQKEHDQCPEVKQRKKEYMWIYNGKYLQKLREEENKRRKNLNLPLLGKGFKKEMELLVYIHMFFQDYEILTHHRKTLEDWGYQGLELDIYIPELKLAFEYMGIQHYKFNGFFHTNKEEFEAQQYRDRCKKRLCKLKGIKLIRIRYDEKLSEQLVLSKLKYTPSLNITQERLG